MSWAVTDTPNSARAFQLSNDRNWKLRHSAWLLWGILTCGLLSFIGFAFVAWKTKRRSWWIAATGWALVGVGYFTYISLSDEARKAKAESSLSSAIGSVLLVLLLISLVHMVLLNRAWLRWLANDQSRREENAASLRAQFAQPPFATQPAQPPLAPPAQLPPPIAQMGVSADTYYADRAPASSAPQTPGAAAPSVSPRQPPPPGGAPTTAPSPPSAAQPATTALPDAGLVQVNTASMDTLTAVLGLDRATVERLVAARANQPYLDLEDLGRRSGLTPVQLHRLSARISFQRPAAPGAQAGRVLDL